MSFGWSATDIVAAVKMLHTVGTALKESGGASSEYQSTLTFLETLCLTLQHIYTLQKIDHEPELAKTLKDHCDQLRIPLDAFLDDIKSRFDSTLGRDTKWYKLQPMTRKIQWATSLKKKVKDLQFQVIAPLTATGLIMVQQTSQTVSRMPTEIQDRVAATIDAKLLASVAPLESAIEKKTNVIATSQANSADLIAQKILESCNTTTAAIHSQAQQSELQHKSFSFSMENRLDHIDTSLKSVSTAVSSMNARASFPCHELDSTATNILGILMQILSNIQLLLRELIILLIPCIVTFYRHALQPLLLYGDRFQFEDGLGRVMRLSCIDYQHWDAFYQLLKFRFQKSPGLSYVLKQQFLILNGYNNMPITQASWAAVIQPGSKFKMAMILDEWQVQKGRCVDPLCNGHLSSNDLNSIQICPVCRKELSVSPFPSQLDFDDRNSLERAPQTTDNDLENTEFWKPSHPPSSIGKHLTRRGQELAAFKRLMWRPENSHTDSPSFPHSKNGPNSIFKLPQRRFPPFNDYFLGGQGIDREVITQGICSYLGNDALVRPTVYQYTGTNIKENGYLICAYRCFTREMIEELKNDSMTWRKEKKILGKDISFTDSQTYLSRRYSGAAVPGLRLPKDTINRYLRSEMVKRTT